MKPATKKDGKPHKSAAPIRLCEFCEKAFRAYKTHGGKRRKFCSYACSYQYNGKGKALIAGKLGAKKGGHTAATKYHRLGKNPQLKKVADKVYVSALRKGLLRRPSICSSCDRPTKIHGHHDDYSKPLDVRWLCGRCHLAWHMQRD